ncbi:hypothetical protein Ancab_018743 [Ancistrocladus abbreviatus]
MGAENGVDEPKTSAGSVASFQVEQPSQNDNKHQTDAKKEEDTTERVPFYKLFSFADSTDMALMVLGSIGAVANGVCMPLMTLLVGDAINAFGNNQFNHQTVKAVSKVSLRFVYLAIGVAVAAFLQVACWMVTGERQAARMRNLYLKTILRQDIGFFDKEANTGEIIGRMSGDTVLIQDAMGEKVGKFIQLMSTFLGGIVIAFVKGWLLTIVMLSCIPLLVAAGGVIAVMASMMATRGQNAYAKAAIVVEQTIGSIRTVASFTGEEEAIANYNKALVGAYKSSVLEGLTTGIGLGAAFLFIFSSYGLAIWFGSKLILERHYNGGTVLTVIFAILTGSMSLGQTTPCISAFAAGQAAAYKMLETINRKPAIDAYDPSGKILDDIRGTHSELLEDPKGAYSQLVRLQETKRELEPQGREIREGLKQSSQQASSLHSLSRGSSGRASSNRHSFSFMFGVDMDPTETKGSTVLASEKVPKVSIRHLASLNRPEIPVLFLGAISAALSGTIFPIYGLLLSSVIKMFYQSPHEIRKQSKFWALIFVVLGVASLLTHPAQNYFFSVAGGKLVQRIRSLCFEKVVHMEVGWFDEPNHSSGAIGARLSADATAVRALVGDALGLLVQNAATAVAGLVIAFVASWQLAFIVLALVPIIGLGGYVQMKFMKGFSADAKKKYEEASQVANDAVGSIRTVASFSAEKKVMQLYEMRCEGPLDSGIRQGLISGAGFGFSNATLFLAYATCFYAGAQLVEHGTTTFSKAFRVVFALTMAAMGISQSSSFTPDSSKAKNTAASIFAILDRKSKIDPSEESGVTLDDVQGEIQLHHVSFKYPTRPDIQILRDLSLTIHAGKTVALVGESGSGKSTVISLLQRFYDPHSGCIMLDGIEIQKFQLKWLRQQMGLVSQEPILFNNTIRANIAYGKKGNATEAETLAAAELANAHNFISALQQIVNHQRCRSNCSGEKWSHCGARKASEFDSYKRWRICFLSGTPHKCFILLAFFQQFLSDDVDA